MSPPSNSLPDASQDHEIAKHNFESDTKIINQGFKIVYDPEVVIRHKVSAERRVTWSGKRYLFNVRNRIYLGSKFNFNAASTVFTVALEIADGVRRGYWAGVLQGTAAGIGLLPQALWRRFADRRVRLTPAAKTYIREALGATGLSCADRARRRVRFALRRATQK